MKIALAIPVIGDVPGEAFGFHMTQAVEVGRLGKLAIFVPLNKMPHDVARNETIAEAMMEQCDLLYFIDDDTIAPLGAFPKLLEVMQTTGARVVSGHYYRRGWPYTCVWSKELPRPANLETDLPAQQGAEELKTAWFPVDALEGIHEIHTSGLGCALIDLRWVSQNIQPPWCEMLKGEKGTIVSDDTTFLTKVREKGGLILGHAGVRCVHLGERTMIHEGTVDYLRQQVILQKQTESGNIPVSGKESSNGDDRKQFSSDRSKAAVGGVVQETRV